MRTTITLSPGTLKAAKRRAAERGVTLSAIIEEALHAQQAEQTPKARPFKLITFDHGSVRSGINLDKTAEIFELDDIEAYGGQRGPR